MHVGMDVDSLDVDSRRKGMPSNTGGVMPSAGQEGEGSSAVEGSSARVHPLRGERAVEFTQVSLHPRSRNDSLNLSSH